MSPSQKICAGNLVGGCALFFSLLGYSLAAGGAVVSPAWIIPFILFMMFNLLGTIEE